MVLRELGKGQRFEFEDKNTPLQWVGANGVKMLQAGCSVTECSDIGRFPARGLFKYEGVTAGTCPTIVCLVTGIKLVAIPGTFNRHVLVIF